MIGNREITDRTRRELWQQFQKSDKELPANVRELIHEIHDLNSKDPEAGFRRRNLPSLLYQYFSQMKMGLGALRRTLKAGGDAFVIIGDNRTVAGGKTIRIPTIEFLQQIAEGEGFTTIDAFPMEMLTNREIHRRNATPSESILWFRN
jgi:site-specific DNA-methyltransferase (cytosine-N4-specific)